MTSDMARKLPKTLLLFSTLSLLVLPMGDKTSAQVLSTGEIVGTIVFGNTLGVCGQPSLSHLRCTSGSFISGEAQLVATDTNLNQTVCSGSVGSVDFATRETPFEGRGRILDVHAHLSHLDGTECRVRISGTFHRVGTVATGRLGLDVHRADGGFRQNYCARFDVTVVPTLMGETLAPVTIEGRAPGCASPDPFDEIVHGRLPTDSQDTLHGDITTYTLPTLPTTTTASTTTTVVPGAYSDDCDDGINVNDGWIEPQTYLKVKVKSPSTGELWICYRLDRNSTPTAHTGGKLVVGGGLASLVPDTNDAYCATRPGNVTQVNTSVGPTNAPVRLDRVNPTVNSSEVFVCAHVGDGLGHDVRLRVAAPVPPGLPVAHHEDPN
jgi:hypothetical protein